MKNRAMPNRPTTHEDMKTANILAAFECLRTRGPLTKRQIQEQTGLSWGSVFNITTFLADRKVIVSHKVSLSKAGRIPELIDLDTENILLIGADVSVSGISGIVMDLKGNIRQQVSQPPAMIDPQTVSRQLCGCIDSLIRHTPDSGRIRGIGVAAMGHVDTHAGLFHPFEMLSDGNAIPLGRLLTEKYGCEAVIDHDTNCLAETEIMYGQARGTDPMIYLRMSYGIGASLFLNGSIYRGASGFVGEIGHNLIQMAQPDAGGEHNATLASVASGHRILIRARELAASGQAPHLAESLQAAQGPLTLEQTAEAALAGDTALRGLFAEAARHTGLALSHLVNILDPQMVIIGGEMAHMEELVMSRVRDCLSRYCASRPPVKLAISPFSRSAASVGAASMIITRVFLKAADICQN